MSLPLDSIRILDLTRLLPGPYCTMLLADYGADVIKIEDPKEGDYARWGKPKIGTESAFFASLNRNKRSVALDLKSEQDKKLFIELIKTADVLVESFRPGVMKRLGLGHEELKKYNENLIYCAITGYGQDGPYSKDPGHDVNYLSYSGMLHLQGDGESKPQIPSVQIADIGGGSLMAAIGILLAIVEAKKTGKGGQFIDISMLDGVISWMQTILPDFLATKQEPNRGELVLNGGKACYQIYETKDQRYLSVGALELKFWKVFCEVIGREKYIPYLDAPTDMQKKIQEDIQALLLTKTQAEWMKLFSQVDACVAPVLSPKEMMANPQVLHRELLEQVHHTEEGIITHIRNPIKYNSMRVPYRRQAPKLGEHNEEIFKELGFSDQ